MEVIQTVVQNFCRNLVTNISSSDSNFRPFCAFNYCQPKEETEKEIVL